VALVSHWVALRNPLSGFSFQLSAFQLLPKGGFGGLHARTTSVRNSLRTNGEPIRMPSAMNPDESLQDDAGLLSRGGQDLPGADSSGLRARVPALCRRGAGGTVWAQEGCPSG